MEFESQFVAARVSRDAGETSRRRSVGHMAGVVGLAGATLVGALAFAATPSWASSAAQGVTSSSITIGMDAILSGPLAPYTLGADQYEQAYFDYVNAHGGIDGRQIKTIVLDSKGDPGQQLLNYNTLWGQDKVAAMTTESPTGVPFAYVKKNDIPIFTAGADPQEYSSQYPTIFTTGGQFPEWASQTAYWLVDIKHEHPKSVAVIYSPADSSANAYIASYWHKLGVKDVSFTPDGGPTASCSANVLKWKSEGVDFIDIQGQSQWPLCIQAEAQLGWKPPMSQGGAVTAEYGIAQLVGAGMDGVVSGAPTLLHTGQPLYKTPPAFLNTYNQAIKQYAGQYDTVSYLNNPTNTFAYVQGVVLVDAFKGALSKYGSAMTTADLISYAEGMKNVQTGLEPVMKSFAPSCKTGADGTIWGYWHYDPTTKLNTFVPDSGSSWVTSTYLGQSPCALTQFANKLYGS